MAVKMPVLNKTTGLACRNSRNAIKAEIYNLNILGKHEHTVTMLKVLRYGTGFIAPVLIMELCALGDLWSYRQNLIRWDGKVRYNIPELASAKLFRDMILGLDFLHRHTKMTFIHGDFKPDNILVVGPPPSKTKGPILTPTFKIADFARL